MKDKKDMYLWLRVDEDVTEQDIIRTLSDKGTTYCVSPLPDFDWSSFRREAAKDILCAMLGREDALVVLQGKRAGELEVSDAISLADELIRQLKQEPKKGLH